MVPAALAAGPGSPRAGPLPLPPTARARTANCRPTTGSPSSAAPPGPGSPDGAVVPAPVRPRAARPELGATRRSAPSSRESCGSGWTWAWTASASTWRTAWSRPTGLPDSVAAPRPGRAARQRACMPFFDQDGVHEIYRAWRPDPGQLPGRADGRRRGVGRRPSSGCARYVRPDELHQAFNFHFLTPPGRRRVARGHRPLAGRGRRSVGAPTTWVLSNHDVSTGTSPGYARRRRRHRACAGPGPPALLMLALPGSAYLYQGEELGLPEVARPARRGAPGPGVPAHRPGRRPRRLPGADPVDGERPPYGFGPAAAAGCRSPATGGR